MSKDHWTLLALFLGVTGAQIAGLTGGWSDALTPTFVGGFLGQLAIVLRAFWTDKATTKRARPSAD